MKTKTSVYSLIASVVLVLAFGPVAQSATIAISNNSFEDPAVSPGTFSATLPTGWSGPSPSPVVGPWVHDPTISTTSDGNAPDGENVLVTVGNAITQTTGSSYVPGTSYSMQVDVGIRGDQTAGSARYDYRIYANGVMIRRDIGLDDATLFSTPGTFLTKTVTSDPIHSAITGLSGAVGVGVGGAGGSTANQVMHDNVRLTDTSAAAPKVFNPSFEAIQVSGFAGGFSPVGWTVNNANHWLVNPTSTHTTGGNTSDGNMALLTYADNITISQTIDETFRFGVDFSLYVDVAARKDLAASGTATIQLIGVNSGYVYGSDSISSATVNASQGDFYTMGFDLGSFGSVPGTGELDESLQIKMSANTGQWLWDNVQFTAAVPEPGTLSLLLAGCACIWGWRVLQRREG